MLHGLQNYLAYSKTKCISLLRAALENRSIPAALDLFLTPLQKPRDIQLPIAAQDFPNAWALTAGNRVLQTQYLQPNSINRASVR
ncbi:hypothetical protein TNCT_708571 [Trichonephila clavata]|uniref:Uncharacterized protein n=1 Tax=Trichonephila clavata TaxID=2740835 RepID=A0A8X6I1T3_TRICU|nr:hypothetical protein TNCT_708571 [Trichonephila clavata]